MYYKFNSTFIQINLGWVTRVMGMDFFQVRVGSENSDPDLTQAVHYIIIQVNSFYTWVDSCQWL